ncbi:CbiQ family ECF transporter T component [Micromonospora endolithica]|uniref:Energy-coupling factor transporter transmembrane protein EcfT n=1 Tax=Micromonospora endolithica TaxID=230091 RepID=A0A3A9ZB16_9ACTN|nr:CbiQ family ECF transporter T component [Micromonospora endolithica]RKN45521.1 energy-coupling factor transporter transmembrane protein EcfT [Micromonospora endolithica]TWJ22944.1 energy-coupling factor transport system permease protein [Micromonospora endolithica]
MTDRAPVPVGRGPATAVDDRRGPVRWPDRRLPRGLHPGAWWLWALGLATAASHTTNPLGLGLLVAVAALVVVRRRGDAPWALAFRMYLVLGAVIVAMRVVFRIVFGGGQGEHVLVRLPEIPLPEWAAGIRLFGPVAAEQLLGGFQDGLRLAAMLVCLGAANALANPKRLLKAVPGALYAVGTAVVVALSVAPQLVESVLRVRRARRLRGAPGRGVRALRGIALPVLADALDRSLALAAAMDSRGYGRTDAVPAGQRAVTGALVLGGLVGVCAGTYGLLDTTGSDHLGLPMLLAGLVVAVAGMLLAGRRVRRSRYRPDRWRPAELLVAGCGVTAAALTVLAGRVAPELLYPPVSPPTWPELTPLLLLAVAAGAAPAWLAPPPPLARPTRPPVPVSAATTDAARPTTSPAPVTGGHR